MTSMACTNEGRTSTVRVLLVEDYEPFRRFICSALGKNTNLQLICKVSDGLEAVQKAEVLHRDLILLDVGLPSLNGIEAARRIRKLSPETKILFVSQECSAALPTSCRKLSPWGHWATWLKRTLEANC